MLSQIRPALFLTAVFTLLFGLVYPLAVTGIAQAAFPEGANGSRIERDGTVIGSDLIGQNFSRNEYFWPRPSATGPDPYNGSASSGSNFGPSGKALVERVEQSTAQPGGDALPADAVTASGSGLDPHITPQNAERQLERVAAARSVAPSVVQSVLEAVTERPLLGIFGEPRVNVLRLNLALDQAAPFGN